MSRLKQQLGISQGVALLATSLLGTGIFVVPAIAASVAERHSLVAWLLLIALVLPIAFTFAALGKRYPHAGGAAHFVGKALGGHSEKLTAFADVMAQCAEITESARTGVVGLSRGEKALRP